MLSFDRLRVNNSALTNELIRQLPDWSPKVSLRWSCGCAPAPAIRTEV